jgi:pyrophosphatase PpaX
VKGPRAVLFDWDGTLLDSAELTLRCYRAIFAEHGIAFGAEDFARTYSPNWHLTYEAIALPVERWAAADARWIELFSRERSRLMPGAGEAVARLRDRGLRLGVVTSGERPRVERDLARHGLRDSFEVLVCAGDVSRRKPDPQGLQFALERLGVGAAQAVYVGDSPEDVLMARAAGVASVGIPGGFPNRDALEASRPELFTESLAQALPQLLGEG